MSRNKIKDAKKFETYDFGWLMMHDEDRIMYNIYEEKEFLSLKMFSFIGHGYDLASFQCYLYNRDMFFKTFY